MKLDGPALVGSVLCQQGLAHRVAHRGLLPGVRTHLAAQDADRIVSFLDGAIEASLDGGDAETDRLTGARGTPLPRGKPLYLAPQGALWRRVLPATGGYPKGAAVPTDRGPANSVSASCRCSSAHAESDRRKRPDR